MTSPDRQLAARQHRPPGVIIRAQDLGQWTDAQGYLDAARQTLLDARQQVADALKAEQNRGYAEGWQAGTQDICELLARTQAAIDQRMVSLDGELTDIAIGILDAVIGDLDTRVVVAAAVRKALQTLDLGSALTLHVAPGMVDGVRAELQRHLDEDIAITLQFREVEGLPQTAGRLVSEFGTVDLSITSQLAILAASLRTAAGASA